MQTVCETLLEWSSSAAIYDRKSWNLAAADYFNLYPDSLQPLSLFIFEQQDVIKSKEALTELKYWILLQEFYRFNRELAINKTRFITTACAGVIADSYSINFSEEQKQIASSIISDEGFHSLSCFSINDQLAKLSNIHFIHQTTTGCSLDKIVTDCRDLITTKYLLDFELICACLLKSAMTKEVELGIILVEEQQIPETIYYSLQKSRLHDEIRHNLFFLHVLELLWATLPINAKAELMPAIQLFTESYRQLKLVGNKEYIARLLVPLSVDQKMLDNAIEYIRNFRQDHVESIHKAMLSLLNQSKVLSEF